MTVTGSTGSTSSPEQEGSSSELLRALADDVRSLVQQELRNAQEELIGKARRSGRAGAMLGGAAMLGALAAGTSAVVLTRTLGRILPPTASAMTATAIYGGLAAALASAGLEEIRRTLPLVPERTVEGVREDVRVAASAQTARETSG
jgi:hypothetical protein